jgi:hypothetical protein|tara:strand:- start:2250 stop:2447 length:198 start_codon:yes stop_codon:yes gene_type:complete
MKTKKSSDQLNAEGLIDLALIFTQRNCNEFFKMNLLKETTFKHKHLDNLVQNYITKKKVSIKEVN